MSFATIVQNRRVQSAAIGAGGFVLGAATGYFVARKTQTEKSVEEVMEEAGFQILDVDPEDLIGSKVEKPEPGPLTLEERVLAPEEISDEMLVSDTPIVDVEEVERTNYSAIGDDKAKEAADEAETNEDEEGTSDGVVETGREKFEDPPLVNIFEGDQPDWDQEREDAHRESHNGPYIISQTEFNANEFNYKQQDLTLYKDDNQLVDNDDAPLYGYSAVVGDLRFGYGSNDPNVVFVRNTKNRAEYQIFLYEGNFAHEVLGQQAQTDMDKELAHSEPRRMRPER